jgi:hypothetical protein
LGKIQTIEFKTALAIVEVLNPSINAVQLLIDNFDIEPEELIQKRWKEMEESQERRLADIQYVDEIADTIGQNLIDDMLKNGTPDKAEIIKKLSNYDFHNNIFYILEIMFYLQEKYADKYNLLFLIADELADITEYKWGEIYSTNEAEKQLKIKINKFLKEEFTNGTTTQEKEV